MRRAMRQHAGMENGFTKSYKFKFSHPRGWEVSDLQICNQLIFFHRGEIHFCKTNVELQCHSKPGREWSAMLAP
jgi:hypothetical protein